MKKLLIYFFLLISMSSFAQERTKIMTPITQKAGKPYVKTGVGISKGIAEIPDGEPIGYTNYDLQTNSSVAKRIIVHPDGTVSAVWTQYQGTAVLTGAPERGTGYNFFNGTEWLYTSESGNKRLEPNGTRTGWPTLVSDGNGRETVYNHVRSAGGAYGWSQLIGESNVLWTPKNASIAEPVSWPRAAQSGQTVVIVGAGETATASGFNMVVTISTNEGTSFTDISYKFGSSSTGGVSGDTYAITARDNYFAIVVFSVLNDCELWKSSDYGVTWNKTTIIDLPVTYNPTGGVKLDMNADGIADVVKTTDGSGDVAIDSQGKVHIVYSAMNYIDTDPVATGYNFFSYTDLIMYWNESMGAGKYTADAIIPWTSTDYPYIIDEKNRSQLMDVIGWCPDLNSNGKYDFFEVAETEYPFGMYYGALSSMASMGIDADDNLYVVYSTVMEGGTYVNVDASPNEQQYRHLFLTKYNGNAWSSPVLISEVNTAAAENVYPTVALNVDGNVHLWVQWDEEPGVRLKEDTDPPTENNIVYQKIPVTEIPDPTYSTHSVTMNAVCDAENTPVTGAIFTFATGILKAADNANAVTFTNVFPDKTYTYEARVGSLFGSGELLVTGDETLQVNIGACASVGAEFVQSNNIQVYPNPAKKHLNITNAENFRVQVVNIAGAEVLNTFVKNSGIDISTLRSGAYFVKVYTDNGIVRTKLVVE